MTKRKTPRTVKSVCFAHDGYEDSLLAYATDPARGKFGSYVKRLIERDRNGAAATADISGVPVTVAENKPDISESKRAMVSGFL